MDIRYIESLIVVADLGSISKAAVAQHLTPAAIGQRIASLEKHFGVSLLDRTSHKATPTPACLHLLPRARQLVNDLHEMEGTISCVGLSGKFNLGAISTILTGIIPSAMRHLAQVAPGLFLQVKPGTSQSLFNDLDKGEIGAAIICLPSEQVPSRFAVHYLRDEQLVLLSRNAAGRTIREKLERNSYICYDSQSWGGAKAAAYLRDKNIRAEPIYELDALEAIEKLVLQGMGVSLVPHWTGLDLEQKNLTANVIKDKTYCRRIVLVTDRHNSRAQFVEALLSALKTSFQALGLAAESY
jgi:DNA-binding transcriptional LysR family regulator